MVGAGLVAVASWQAASLRAGLLVSGGFAGVALVLYGAAWLLVRAARPLARSPWFPLRHAVLGLGRPGNQTRVILLSVGLGCFFVLGVRTLQQNLVSESVIGVREGSADLFVIDIQPDQESGVREILDARQEGGPRAPIVPTLRARVTGVRGRDINLESYADVHGRGSLAREYTVTYRPTLGERRSHARPILAGAGAGRTRDRTGSVNRAQHPRAVWHRGQMDAVRRGRSPVRGACHERPARALGGRAQRWLHVRVPAGGSRQGAAHVRGFRPRPRRGRRARGFSSSSCPDIRTSAPSMPGTSFPGSSRSSITSCWRSRSSGALRSPAAF